MKQEHSGREAQEPPGFSRGEEVKPELLQDLLAVPVGPKPTAGRTPKDLTREVTVSRDRAEVLINDAETKPEGAAVDLLRERGLDPSEWEVTTYRTSAWTMLDGEEGVSNRYSFSRKRAVEPSPDIEELLAAIDGHPRETPAPDAKRAGHPILVGIGDMQLGKVDGDGVTGTVARAMSALEGLTSVARRTKPSHIHVAWLGDHVEGFTSQGGANVWRTSLTLTEQLRLSRRIMLEAVLALAPLTPKLTMGAVPGNHGDPQRFTGKGVTRYDDSHDTEALVCVAEATALNPDRFSHVTYQVPDTDELVIQSEVGGLRIAQAHGHMWTPGKHFDWWKGQAFDAKSAMHDANVLLAGHLHHLLIEQDGPRTFVQVPALESESTWWRHRKGSRGNPGIFVATVADGALTNMSILK